MESFGVKKRKREKENIKEINFVFMIRGKKQKEMKKRKMNGTKRGR